MARRFRAAALLLALFVTAAPGPSASAADWPQWRGPTGDGRLDDVGLSESWPVEGLATLWRRPIGGGYAGIAVVENRVLTLDRSRAPREVERILCLDAGAGEPLWSHEYEVAYADLDYGNGPRACPTIVGDRVYTLGALGHLKCLDLSAGSVVWEKRLEHDLNGRRPTWGYAASPLVVDGRVIIQPGGENGFSIVSLDAATGDLQWHSHSDEAGYAWPIVVEHGGATQLVCWTPSHIRGVDLRSGAPLWEVPYEVQYGVSIATPIVQEGLVLVCGYWNGSRAIRLGTPPGETRLAWEEDRYLRGLMSQPLYRDSLVYLLDKQYGLTCFELRTGRRLWHDGNRLTPRGRNPQVSLVWIGESDRILALNAEGELVQARIGPAGYTELARHKIIGETWAHPAFSGRRVFARSDTEIVCIELP